MARTGFPARPAGFFHRFRQLANPPHWEFIHIAVEPFRKAAFALCERLLEARQLRKALLHLLHEHELNVSVSQSRELFKQPLQTAALDLGQPLIPPQRME
jgi:hypothetical protein